MADSNPTSPLIFVLSPGVDPTNQLLQLAEQSGITFNTIALGQGQVSPVVVTPQGCFILRCEEMSRAKLKSLAEVRGQIEQTLLETEQQAREDKWFEQLKRKSYVRQFSF